MYILWKDHKPNFSTKLQTRPLCDGIVGPLARISEVLVLMLKEFMEGDERISSSGSTEEILRSVQETNKYSLRPGVDYALFSMDVESLYPSLDHKEVGEAVFDPGLQIHIFFCGS